MTDFRALLTTLVEHEVEFVLVGGVAAAVHGSARTTQDVDIVYGRAPANLKRLTQALGPHHPILRGAPPGLPFVFDETTLRMGLNFTLTTDLGDIDLLGEIPGGGTFSHLIDFAESIEIYGVQLWCLGLDKLIDVKRAAGRPKDLQAVAELEQIRAMRSPIIKRDVE